MHSTLTALLISWALSVYAQDAPMTTLPAESYHAVHAHTEYWQEEGTSHKWIGVNTELLTELPYLTTVDNQPATTTVPVHIVASTVTTAEQGYETGDVAIALSPKWMDALKNIAGEVEAEVPCAGKKRQICALTEARITAFVDKVVAGMEKGGSLEFLKNIPLPRIMIKAPDIASFVSKIASRRVMTIAAISLVTYRAAQAAKGIDWNPVIKLASNMLEAVSGGGDDGDDMPKCPTIPACDDCEGIAGFCTTNLPACPCEEKCPAEKPKCEDEQCKGDEDDECTVKNRGCKCTRECETAVEAVPHCDDCGGNDGDDKCKGIEKENNKWKSCECYQWKNDDLLEYPKPDDPQDVMKGPEFQEPKHKEDPANHHCNGQGDKWMSSNGAKVAIEKFCSGSEVRNWGEGLLRERRWNGGMANAIVQGYEIPNADTTINIYAFEDDDCIKQGINNVKIDYEQCVWALEYVIDQCEDKNDENKKFGGGANIHCQYYNITPEKPSGNTLEPGEVPHVE